MPPVRVLSFARGVLLLATLVLAACGDEQPVCIDEDGDGYGENCALGPDCDDLSPVNNVSCGPAADCDLNPSARGCPCLPPGVTTCFPGSEEQRDQGLCRGGRTTCRQDGTWGVCVDSVAPQPEFCDGSDQDCDGRIDENVTSPCGGCTPGCIGGVWGEGDTPFVADDFVALTPEGFLTLPHDDLSAPKLWVANSGEDTVSRVDIATLREDARYASAMSPSRVAVDYRGNGWALSRNFGGVGRLHEYAGDDTNCVDRDGDGSLQTSRGAALFEDDECVLRSVDVGEVDGIPRAIAIDGNLGLDGSSGGDIWVGLHGAQRVLHIDGASLEVLDDIPTPDFSPYAFAFDDQGVLWGISRDGLLLRLDRYDLAAGPEIVEVPIPCFELYGLAVDGRGRVAMSGFGCNQVTLYDPTQDRWSSVATEPSGRGMVAEGETFYLAHTAGLVSELSASPLGVVASFGIGSGFESIGVGMDTSHVFVASGQGDISGSGLVAVLERAGGTLVAEIPVGFAPHTQGDLTGAKRRGAFRPEGSARHVFEGCADGNTRWGDLRVAASLGGGMIEVHVRQATERASLEDAAWLSLGAAEDSESVFATDFVDGGVVEVELVLTTEAVDTAPRVRRVGIEWSCDGPI